MRGAVLTVARLGFAVAAIVAITYQFASLRQGLPTFNPGNFFSFLTIQTNLLAIAMLALVVVVRPPERTVLFDAVRGAVTLYIAITGLVFALLLAGLQESLDTHIAWGRLHSPQADPGHPRRGLAPRPPQHRLSPRIAAFWLLYLFAYLVYTLVRGRSVGWYPYPFLDVSQHGYGGVLLSCVAMLLGMVVLAAAFVLVGNRRVG